MTGADAVRRRTYAPVVAAICLIIVVALAGGGATGVAASRPLVAAILTARLLARVDVASGRVLTARPITPGGRKVVFGGDHLFVLRGRTVEILHRATLRRQGGVEFPQEILDIDASGPLLFVSAGQRQQGSVRPKPGTLHILRAAPNGTVAPVKRLLLPKAPHALAVLGTDLYAVDDVFTPFYLHHIDASRPQAPRLTSLELGAVYGHVATQAIADRWYVTISHQINIAGQRRTDLAALPLRPPLKVVARWQGAGRTAEFRVHARTVYWQEAGWLWRRRLDAGSAEKIANLGPFVWPLPEQRGTIDLIGNRLYVVAGDALWVFDLDPKERAAQVLRVQASSTIISVAIEPLR